MRSNQTTIADLNQFIGSLTLEQQMFLATLIARDIANNTEEGVLTLNYLLVEAVRVA